MAGGSTSKRKSQRSTRSRRDRKPNPTAQLTDDLLLEIIARVPYRSLRHCLCVCQRWCALISHPDNRARLPHTLAGFFYPLPFDFDDDDSQALTPTAWPPHDFGFLNVSGTGASFIDPCFSFLPDREREHMDLVDCCNGLILCRSYRCADYLEFHYLVLNPATEKWVAIRATRRWSDNLETVRLGFDPAVSPHFYVFEFQLDFDDDGSRDGHVLGVKIYSSATEAWIDKQSGWIMKILLEMRLKSVFLDGVLYVIATRCIIGAVDVKEDHWLSTQQGFNIL